MFYKFSYKLTLCDACTSNILKFAFFTPTASGGLNFGPNGPDLLSGFVLSVLSLLCTLHEI